jgi:hypothetical protein
VLVFQDIAHAVGELVVAPALAGLAVDHPALWGDENLHHSGGGQVVDQGELGVILGLDQALGVWHVHGGSAWRRLRLTGGQQRGEQKGEHHRRFTPFGSGLVGAAPVTAMIVGKAVAGLGACAARIKAGPENPR